MVTTYIKKFGLQFLELYTEREFGNVVDRYAVTVMKDSGASLPISARSLGE